MIRACRFISPGDTAHHRDGKVHITSICRIDWAKIEGFALINEAGRILSDITIPGANPLFIAHIRALDKTSFRILTNLEIWYPVSGVKTLTLNYNLLLGGAALTEVDLVLLKEATKLYCRQFV